MAKIQMMDYFKPIQMAGYNIKRMEYYQTKESSYSDLSVEVSISVTDTEKIKLEDFDLFQSVIELSLIVKESDEDLFDIIIEGGYNSPASIGKDEFVKLVKQYALFELFIIIKEKVYEMTSINSFDSPLILPFFDLKTLSDDIRLEV